MARRRMRSLRRRALRGLLAAAGALILACAGFVAFWQVYGFPASVARSIRSTAYRRGVLLDFSRVRLDLPRGVVLEDLTIVSGPGSIHFRMESAMVSTRLRWSSLFFARTVELREAVVHGGRLYVLDDSVSVDAIAHPEILVDAKLKFGHTGVEIRRIQGTVLGTRLDIRGQIRGAVLPSFRVKGWRKRPVPVPDPAPLRWPDLSSHVDQWRRIRDWRAEFMWDREPVFTVDLDLDLENPASNEARARLVAGQGAWMGARIESIRCDLAWTPDEVRMPRAEARFSRGTIGGTGVWCLRSDSVTAQLEGDGDWSFFRTGLPRRLAEVLHEAHVSESGALQWGWAWDAVPRLNLGNRGQGRIRWVGGRVDTLAVPELAFNIDWDRPRLRFDPVTGRLGEGALSGPLSGHVEFDVERRHVEATVDGGFDPAPLLPWLLPNQARYAGAVVFLSEPPSVKGHVSGSWAQRQSMRMRMAVRGRDFIYNGAYVESASADVMLDGAVLTLHPMRVTRPEGELTGWVIQDLAASKAEFDVESRLSPHAAARMIGPAAHRFAQRFRFEGPSHIRARGRVQAEAGWDNAFTVEFEGSDFGVERFVAQQVVFHASVVERTIRVEEAHGIYAGGLFQGRAEFVLSEDGSTAPAYDAEVKVADVDLATLASDVLREDTAAYEGKLGAELRLRGRIGAGQGSTVEGDGRVEIRGTGLMRIPVMGGLSSWLSRLYPGLGFVTQDVMASEFTVGRSRVSSDSIALRGTVISLDGSGHVYFDGRLNCRAQVRLLREGLAAEAVRVLTFPLTKLLEFDLIGTFGEPRWRPRNFSVD